MMNNKPQLFVLSVMVLALTACGGRDMSQLQAKMDQIRKETPIKVPEVSEPKVFVPADYTGANLIDPFEPRKLLDMIERVKSSNDNGKRPDLNRPKEALEAFSIEEMKMVGLIGDVKLRKALVQVGKVVYTVRVGNFIGQNFGKIVKISESNIDFIETVQDPSGDWIERKASLELQEAKK